MKKAGIATLCALTVITCALLFLLQKPHWLFWHRQFKAGNELVRRVEAFRATRNHLPTTAQDINFEDPDEEVFYEKVNDDEYVVWFGTSLGESETYSSKTKMWD